MAENYLSGFICGLSGQCRSLHFFFLFCLRILLDYTYSSTGPFWLFISWHHNSHDKEYRALQYWQQGSTGKTLMAWEKCGITAMFVRLTESKRLLKWNPPRFSVMILQLRRENKLFHSVPFVGLAWEHGIDFAQAVCNHNFFQAKSLGT